MNQTELNKDWIVENAVLAFVGALLVAPTLQPPYETYRLPFWDVTFNVPDPVSFIIATILFVVSFFLVLAYFVRPLGQWALREVPKSSPLPEMLTWLAFTVSWLSVVTKLADGPWWIGPLEWGGLVMFLFLVFRILRGMYRLIFVRMRTPGNSRCSHYGRSWKLPRERPCAPWASPHNGPGPDPQGFDRDNDGIGCKS